MNAENSSNEKSYFATVSVRRLIRAHVNEVFDAWIDPEIRRAVLLDNRYKNGVKEVSPLEGGVERYEDRWRNRLISTTTRRYVAVKRPKLIISHVETILGKDFNDWIIATQELLLFKEVSGKTELEISFQGVATEPLYNQEPNAGLNRLIDVFLTKSALDS